MLLTKKTKFSVNESQIKEDILSSDGEVLLKINIRYPEITCMKNDCLSKYAKPFYVEMANAFSDFSKNELQKRALADYTTDKQNFKPYSALMRFDLTFLDKDFLSVMQEISVSDGKKRLSFEKKTQVWERVNGTKCRLTDFMGKQEIEDFKKKHQIKQISDDLFVLREDGLEFFVKKENKYFSLYKTVEK